jgi:hypothetical protein
MISERKMLRVARVTVMFQHERRSLPDRGEALPFAVVSSSSTSQQ